MIKSLTINSLSEYGCNTNTREWNEVEALYDLKMTGVYSGGLAYEYTMEANEYGLVELSDDLTKVNPLPDFATLKKAFAATPNPSGNGGYNATGGPSNCPAQSANWNVTTDALPAMPEEARKYLTEGAGEGAGILGSGSQNSGGRSSGTASQGSGAVTAVASNANGGASATSSPTGNAASSLRAGSLEFAPFVISALCLGFTGLGAFLL